MKAGWKTVTLGEVCEVLDYKRRPVTKADRRAGPYPYYGATGIQDHVDQFIFDEPLVLLGEDGAKWKSGDRSAFQVSGKTWVNNHAHVLRPNREVVVDEWLIYWLNHSDLTEFVTGVTVPKLNQANMIKIPVELPPLAEQKRIVALLDEAFAGIDAAKAKAEANMRDAAALFASKLEETFLPSSQKWSNSTVGEIISDRQGEVKTGPFGTKLSASEYGKEGVPVISVGEIRMGEILLHTRTPKVGPSVTKRMPEYLLEKGDIVFGRKGGVERSAYITDKEAGWFLGSDGIRLRLPSSCDKLFIAYQLLRPAHQSWMKSKATGTTMPSLNQGIIENIPILLCDYDLQCSIVKELEGFETRSKPLKDMYIQKMSALNELKSAILAQAFAGELTA